MTKLIWVRYLDRHEKTEQLFLKSADNYDRGQHMGVNGIKTAGMSNADGCCEAVPIYKPPSAANPQNAIIDDKSLKNTQSMFQDAFVMGSTGGSTLGDPKECANAIMGLAQSLFMAMIYTSDFMGYRLLISSPNLDTTSEERVFKVMIKATGLVWIVTLLQDLYYRSGMLSFYRIATPPGWIEQAYLTWDKCGRPGSGLGKKITDWAKNLRPKAAPVPNPAPSQAFMPHVSKSPIPQPLVPVTEWAIGLGLLILVLQVLQPELRFAASFTITPQFNTKPL